MRLSTDVHLALASVKMPMNAIARIAATFRPKRSATGPRLKAPIIMPTRLALKTGPKAAGATLHCFARTGATKPIDWASNPSIMVTTPQIRTVAV